MIKKLTVYDWKISSRDDDFRKYKKIYVLPEIDLDNDFSLPIGTELSFGNGNKARIVRYNVDMIAGITTVEAVVLNKWLM